MTPLARKTQALALAVTMGLIDQAAFLAITTALLAAMRTRAATRAEADLCRQLDAPPFGLWLPDASPLYEASLTTVLDSLASVTPGSPDALSNLVEVIEDDSRHEATTKAMTIHHVERYRLVVSADACDKCKADDGNVYPVSKSPSHHNHCKCEAQPIKENPQ